MKRVDEIRDEHAALEKRMERGGVFTGAGVTHNDRGVLLAHIDRECAPCKEWLESSDYPHKYCPYCGGKAKS